MQQPIKQILPSLRPPQEDSPDQRRQRALAGGIYGLIAASAFTITAALVDVLTYPDLPIYVDWGQATLVWLALGATLMGVGALVGWSSEGLVGIGLGAAALNVTVLGLSLAQSDYALIPKIVIFIILSLPVTAASVPVALGLRWLIRLRTNLSGQSGWDLRRGLIVTLLLAVLGGAVPGLLARMPAQAEQAMIYLHARLTDSTPPDTGPYSPFRAATRLGEHWGMPFTMRQTRSLTSTEGYDITVRYADGYTFECTVVVYRNYAPYVRACRER